MSTRKLQQVMSWARPFLKNQPLDMGNMEPALTTANMVMQTILAPPLRWRWNRNTATIPMVTGQTDYPAVVPDFGVLEDAWLASQVEVYPIEISQTLPTPPATTQRPKSVAAQFDNGNGVITFRTDKNPDQAYTLGLTWQRNVPALQSLASTLGPIPDSYAFLFEWGFLTITSLLVNDPRFSVYERYFIGKLLGLQEGLDQASINIFLGQWEMTTKTAARAQIQPQQGAQGRAQ